MNEHNNLKIQLGGDDSYFQNTIKPPLGISPREVIDKERFAEIITGIRIYIEAGENIPVAWVEELYEIINRMKLANQDMGIPLNSLNKSGIDTLKLKEPLPWQLSRHANNAVPIIERSDIYDKRTV